MGNKLCVSVTLLQALFLPREHSLCPSARVHTHRTPGVRFKSSCVRTHRTRGRPRIKSFATGVPLLSAPTALRRVVRSARTLADTKVGSYCHCIQMLPVSRPSCATRGKWAHSGSGAASSTSSLTLSAGLNRTPTAGSTLQVYTAWRAAVAASSDSRLRRHGVIDGDSDPGWLQRVAAMEQGARSGTWRMAQ